MKIDDRFILIMILGFTVITIILSKIPQLNPSDMFTRKVTPKKVMQLFLIALAVFILLMIVVVGLLMIKS